MRFRRSAVLAPRFALVMCLVAGLVAGCGGGTKTNSVKYTPTSTVSLSVDPTAPGSSTASASGSASGTASTAPTSTPTGLRGTALPAGVPTTGQNVYPGEKPPILTSAGETHDAHGAELFAGYWETAVDWAMATLDSTLARSLYSPECATCESYFAPIDAAKSAGEEFIGGRISVTDVQPAINDGRRGATQAVALTLTQTALEVRAADGNVLESDPAVSSILYGVWLAWSSRGWTVVDWGHK